MPSPIVIVVALLVVIVGLTLVLRRSPRDNESPHSAAQLPAAGSDVKDLARAGKKIEAIKLYRAQTGLGLKEAKDAVDALPVDPR